MADMGSAQTGERYLALRAAPGRQSRLSYQHRGFELHGVSLHSCTTCPLYGARASLFSLVKHKMLCFVGSLGEWTSHGELVGSALSTGTTGTGTVVHSQI